MLQAQEIAQGKKNNTKCIFFNARIKRNTEDETLEEATARGNYAYWLSQEDIADIARIHYNNFKRIAVSSEFEVLGSAAQLKKQIESFKLKSQHLEVARLVLIINLGNLHWVTLAISLQNGNYVGYYVDSKDDLFPDDYYAQLNDLQISLIRLGTDGPQQTDDFNCGLWALKNADTLNEMLDESWPLYQVIGELKQLRTKAYFDKERQFFSSKFRADAERNARRLHRIDSVQISSLTANEPVLKKPRISESKEEKTLVLLEAFLEAFVNAFMKRIGAYHLAAKGERLTDAALKLELKTGLTG